MTVEDRYGAGFVEPSLSARPKPGPEIVLGLIACIAVPLGITLGFGFHEETQVVAAVIGVACLVLGLAYPFWGLIIFIGLLYTRPEDTIVVLRGMHFTLVAAVVTVVSVALQMLMDKEWPVKTPVNGLIVGFGVIAVLSTFGGDNTVVAAMDIGKLVALVLMILNLVRTRSRYRILVAALIVFTLYLSGYSIFLFCTGAALKREGILQAQGSGIFGDPNDLSATIAAGLGLTLASIVQAKGPLKFLYALCSLFMIGGIYLTNSRGGMLAMIGVLAAFALLFSRAKWVAIVLTIVIAVGAIKFGPSRMASMNTSEESANSRFRFWDNGVQSFAKSPIMGIGYDRFTSINNGWTAHNSYVLCFTELGLLGYFCWTGCIYYCFQRITPFRPKALPEPNSAGTPPNKIGPGARPAVGFQKRPVTVSSAPAARTARTDPDFCDRMGARLALSGFLMAAFWISRTYIPVLYVLLALPISQQIAAIGAGRDFSESMSDRTRNWAIILLLCIGSIVFIWLLSSRLKQ